MSKIFEGFKNFILRGNAVDLAVGVVIGAAFSGLVTALVKDLMTPLIGANAFMSRINKKVPTIKKCPECLSDIPVGAKRCAHCSQLIVDTK